MTQTNKTSEIEYCEECGSMTILGVCRRCTPTPTYSKAAPKAHTHDVGVTKVMEALGDKDIVCESLNRRGVDFVIQSGGKVLVRAMQKDGRVALINGSLDYLHADYVVIVIGVRSHNPKFYVLDIATAITKSRNHPYVCDGRDDWFLDPTDYQPHRDDWTALTGY